jgi:hypothetical protein
VLKPGGRIYIEDLSKRSDFTADYKRRLYADVYVPDGDLPTAEEYEATLKGAGFGDVVVEDKTDVWSAFVQVRSGEERSDELRMHVYGYQRLMPIFPRIAIRAGWTRRRSCLGFTERRRTSRRGISTSQ